MNSAIFLHQNQLIDFLLHVAPVRPVFIWGPPGIGKSSASRKSSAAKPLLPAAFDHGPVLPEEIADRFALRSRGDTILQPGINLLENAADFPEKGPLLLITDGQCDAFTVHRKHAILLPAGHSLPVTPQGPVFRFSDKA